MKKTKRQLLNKKEELEQWLFDNSKEHEARPMVEFQLKKVNEELSKWKD